LYHTPYRQILPPRRSLGRPPHDRIVVPLPTPYRIWWSSASDASGHFQAPTEPLHHDPLRPLRKRGLYRAKFDAGAGDTSATRCSRRSGDVSPLDCPRFSVLASASSTQSADVLLRVLAFLASLAVVSPLPQALLQTQHTPLSQHHPARTSPRPPADAAHAGSHAPAAASSCVSSYTYLVPILSFYHSTPRILDSWTPGAPSHLNPRPLESSTPSCSSHNTNRLFWTKCAMIQHSGSPP
jgi:hypothetical protein